MPVLSAIVMPPEDRPLTSRAAPWDEAESSARRDGQKRPLVLVIEDNVGDVLLVEEALREHRIDCDLKVVADGGEAMRLVQSIDLDPKIPVPKLVLLDLNLPKRSGHEILDTIRRSTRFSTMPVIVVTSSQAQSDLAQISRLGVSAYFNKPASFEEFMKLGALVRDLL
jgi:CheY-like chemotaxis protein